MMPDVHELQLENGFKAFIVERRGLPLVATVLWYRVGSRDERSGETGLAHFLEHMMFKGTDRYAKGEIDALTAKLGGNNNAFTDHDGTAYHFALASDRWETALEIEANRMESCTFLPKEFDAERSVVLDELARGEDDPWNELSQATEALAFHVHPYHHPVIGHRQDLERVTVEGMRAFYERHYGANRAFLVVVGDVDRKRTEKRIRQLFGGMRKVEPRALVLEEPTTRSERRGVVRAPGNISRIALACRTCKMGERDDFSLDVLSHVLGSGRSSRLHKRLVIDEEIATSLTTHNEPRLDPGLFWVVAELRPGADPERAEGLIREEIAKICADGITAAELKRARVQIRSSFLFEEETVLDTALKIGRFEALADGGFRLLDRVLAIYDDIDRRELRETAARFFGPDSWTVVWSLPEDAELARPTAKGRARRGGTRPRGIAEASAAARPPAKKATRRASRSKVASVRKPKSVEAGKRATPGSGKTPTRKAASTRATERSKNVERGPDSGPEVRST